MYYIKFDNRNGSATIYKFERKAEIICGTPVFMNRLVLSETGLAPELLPKAGIVPVSKTAEIVDFANVEYNIEGWCGLYGEGFNGATTISKYRLKDMYRAEKTDEKFTVDYEGLGVYRFNPPIEHFVKDGAK